MLSAPPSVGGEYTKRKHVKRTKNAYIVYAYGKDMVGTAKLTTGW